MTDRSQIVSMLTAASYFPRFSNASGQTFSNPQGNLVTVSGFMVIMRCGGMTRPFSFERAWRLGVIVMERLTRMIPSPHSVSDPHNNYDIIKRQI